jgi:hypothetical protein
MINIFPRTGHWATTEQLATAPRAIETMRVPKLRSAAFWIAVSLDVILVVAMASVLFNHGKRTDDRGPQAKPSAKVAPAKVEPEVSRHVTRQPRRIRFRVVDAAGAKPVALARVVIDNGNLVPELGADSDAVTWPDGRAIITHKFFVWEERRGDQRLERQVIIQGPWIHVSAEGYEPQKMPLSELLGQEGVVFDPLHETIVTLRRSRAGGRDLADLVGDYIYGNGFVYEHLEVSLTGQYHYKWQNDVRTNEPHDEDRFESRGRCSVADGVLRLVPEGPFSSELRDMMGNNFVPVRWEDRRYLIPEKERLVFCSAVNQGGSPRYMRSGPFTLSDADRRKPPKGLPEVPPEWAPFLLQKPVSGAITEILGDQVAILSAGAKDGLKAGMEFVRDNRLPSSRIRVLFTETDHCIVRISTPEVGALPDSSSELFAKMMGRPQPIVVGERLSSRPSDPEKDFFIP